MRVIAVLSAALVIGCAGSSTSPSPPSTGFNGTWKGMLGTENTIVLYPTQTDTLVSGTGTLSNSLGNFAIVLTGTSTPPALHLIMRDDGDYTEYRAVYVTPDSVAGTVTFPLLEPGTVIPFSMARK